MAPPEILLQGRRPASTSRGHRRGRSIFIGLLLVGFALTVTYIVFRRATGYAIPEAGARTTLRAEGDRLIASAGAGHEGSLERVGRLWVVRAAGEPYALGHAVARLTSRLASADAEWDLPLHGDLAGGVSGFRRDLRLRWDLRDLARSIPPAHRREAAGMAAALDQPYQRLIWRQAAIDTGREGGALDAPPGGLTAALAFVVATPPPAPAPARNSEGAAKKAPAPVRPLVGRSFGPAGAWPPADPVVAVLRPEGAIAFVRVGWGGELGAVTGINASGLFVAVNPTATEDAGEGEVPVAILGRQLLERAHSLDEALAILKQTKPLGAATFLLVDGAGHWMVVERSPGAVAVARDKPRAAIGDFLAASEFAKDADNQRTRRARGGAARLLRLGELLGAAVADPGSVAAVLRDRRGPAGAPLPGWSPQAVADLGAQHTVVVDPAEMILWVGEGPGGAAGFRAFDLRAELLGAAPRQLTALPADPEMAPEGIPKIVEALRELARADRLVRRGEGEPAAEAAWRALALAPDLALPHKLLGDIARAAGDGARARAHYRRFLELGPRDESAADAVRAYQGL